MVSFQLTDEQKMLKNTIFSFAEEKIRPIARECDESGNIPQEIEKKFWELGIIQSMIPDNFGGIGGERDAITSSLILEELGWGDLSIALHLLSPTLFIVPILEEGTDEQKKNTFRCFVGTILNLLPVQLWSQK